MEPTNRELIGWGYATLAECAAEHARLVARAEWHLKHGIGWHDLIIRDACGMLVRHERLQWCILEAENKSEYCYLRSEYYRYSSSRRVGSGVLDRQEAAAATSR